MKAPLMGPFVTEATTLAQHPRDDGGPPAAAAVRPAALTRHRHAAFLRCELVAAVLHACGERAFTGGGGRIGEVPWLMRSVRARAAAYTWTHPEQSRAESSDCRPLAPATRP